MSQESLNLEGEIALLKNIVKYSHLPGQKHLDLTLAPAGERLQYEEALLKVQTAVRKGEITQAEVNKKIGLD